MFVKKYWPDFNRRDYLKCLGGKIKKKTSSLGVNTDNPKEKKYLTDWFKKKK